MIALKKHFIFLAIVCVTLVVMLLLYLPVKKAKQVGSMSNNSSPVNSNNDASITRDFTGRRNGVDDTRQYSIIKKSWSSIIDRNLDPENLYFNLSVLMQKRSSKNCSVMEIKNLIDQSFGEGAMRDNLYKEMFKWVAIDDQLISVYTSLSIKDRAIALVGIAEGIGSKGDFSDMKIAELNLSSAEYQNLVKRALETRLLSKYAKEQEYDFSLLNVAKNLKLESSYLNGFQEYVAEREPFGLYSFLTSSGDKIDGPLLSVISRNATRISPARAMQLFISDPRMTSYVSDAAIGMMKIDQASYQAWYDSESSNFSYEIKDHLNFAEAKHSLVKGSLKAAWDNVNEIKDPEIKKKAEGQVWAKECDMVRNTVNAAPQKAIEELVSGKSQHDSYWIEEAMDVWMAKDFDNAEKWYQHNWKNLPADKAQYAAASFAKQAINTGDIEVAEQWLPYIQDPKTKARIEADIDKALKN